MTVTNIRVKPIDTSAPGSFRERNRIMRALKLVTSTESIIEGQLLIDELLLSRFETTDGSDLEAALSELSAEEADSMIRQLLVTEVPTKSAES